MQAFREFRVKCGPDANITLSIDVLQNDTWPVTMTRANGVVIGDLETSVLNLSMLVSNGTVTNMSVLDLAMNFQAKVNVHLQDMVLFLEPESIKLAHGKVLQDRIGMYSHNYDVFFQAVLNDMAHTFKMKHRKGIDLSSMVPQIAQLDIRNTTVSPYVADEWLYAGFSFEKDMEAKRVKWV